jgi:GTP cyclohydrolase I
MDRPDLERLFAQVDRAELTDFLQKAIQIPSHKDYPDEEHEIGEFIAARMRAEGIETEMQYVDGKRANVISTLRGSGGGKSVTFNGHIDSIPPIDMQDAFSGKIEGDLMYGRGASDMKSGIICMAYAMIAMKRAGLTPAGDVVLSAVAGEEYGSIGCTQYVKRSTLTDYGVCGEPTGLKIASAQKGLHWFEFSIPGRRIHSSVSSQGINALKRLNELMIVGPITVRSACSHHFCPIMGRLWIGLMPNEHSNLIGLSKYSRLAEWVMSRPQIQEEAITQMAELLMRKVSPDGLAVVMEADHFCMHWRGVKDAETKMINSVMRGSFLKDATLRREFLSLINLKA